MQPAAMEEKKEHELFNCNRNKYEFKNIRAHAVAAIIIILFSLP